MPLLNIDKVVPGTRMRQDLGDIETLAASIKLYGLIQPIVVNQDNVLVAGGRRLAACRQAGLTEVPVVYKETLSEDALRELELEENVRRKDMSWQERCISIAEIHTLKSRNAALAGTQWGMRETGELLNLGSPSSVQYAVSVAKCLRANDKEIAACPNMSDALRLLLRRKEDEANRLLMASTHVATAANKAASASAPAVVIPEGVDAPPEVYLSNMLFQGSCLDLLARRKECFSYIISDPPYAIDMDNLVQDGASIGDIDRVVEEHDVQENLSLLRTFIPLAYQSLRDVGWMVLWCDPWNWRLLADLSEQAGFRVQRWPLVWNKTSSCINQMASKNFTKNVEFALVAAKGSATLLTPQPQCVYSCGHDETRKLYGHPFVKPKELWTWLYKAIVMQRVGVLDPFAGVGSACVAAVEYGAVPLACELNELHYPMLVENVRNAYLKKHSKTVFK